MEKKSNKKDQSNGIQRREFIRAGATFAAGAGLMGLGTSSVFGASSNSFAQTAIENVSLNNGVQMPILGFGTLYLNGEM